MLPTRASKGNGKPAAGRHDVVEHGKEIVNNNSIQFERQDNGYAIFTVSAGKFSFAAK